MPTYEAGPITTGAMAARTLAATGAVVAAGSMLGPLLVGEVIDRAKAPADAFYAPPDPIAGQLWPLEIEVDEVTIIYKPVAIGDITGLSAALAGKAAVGFTGNEVVSYEAGTALLKYRAVVINSSGKAIYADKDNNSHGTKVIGITLQEAAGAGEFIDIRNYGQVEDPSWSWALDQPIYLGDDGQPTQTPPTSGFRLQLGFPITPTRIFIDINDPTYLNGGGSWNYNEVPTGLINGFNNTFTTAHDFVAGKTIVYLNGLRQRAGYDYTESGSDQIVFATAPSVSDTLVMDYLAA